MSRRLPHCARYICVWSSELDNTCKCKCEECHKATTEARKHSDEPAGATPPGKAP